MKKFASTNEQLDELLETLCVELALTETQHLRAVTAYETVGEWLSAETSLLSRFRPLLFPQGSLPLGLAVKPRGRDDFDADGVCEFTASDQSLTAQTAYDLLAERLSQHGTYRSKLSLEERCIRVNYENNLHLDIIPAISAKEGGSRLLVPNSGRTGWQPTDPKGFQRWFRSCEHGLITLDKQARVEEMPAVPLARDRTPLQRTAQLFKRRRDVWFHGSPLAPKSILLTTLVGTYFRQETFVTDATLSILSQIPADVGSGVPPAIWNPSNPGENLARQWKELPHSYQAFADFIADFRVRLRQLLATTGMDNIAVALKELFDPDNSGTVERAVSQYTASFQNRRLAGAVGMRDSRLISAIRPAAAAAAVAIPRNSFYGR